MLLTVPNRLQIFHSTDTIFGTHYQYFHAFMTLSARSGNHLLQQAFATFLFWGIDFSQGFYIGLSWIIPAGLFVPGCSGHAMLAV
jgi:hypothetical protein